MDGRLRRPGRGFALLSFQLRQRWTYLMTLGIARSIIVAVIQATGSLRLSLVWDFDHNGIFHPVQIPGVAALVAGILQSTGWGAART